MLVGELPDQEPEVEDSSEPILNIEDYGAIPYDSNTGFDNSVPINNLINAIGNSGYCSIYVPGTRYGIQNKINVPYNCRGLTIFGTVDKYHTTNESPAVNERTRNRSMFFWVGDYGDNDDNVMLEINAPDVYCKNLSFFGRINNFGDDGLTYQTATANNRAKYGIVIKATGTEKISNIYLTDATTSYCQYGIVVGGKDNEADIYDNSINLSAGYLQVRACATGFYQRDNFNVNTHINQYYGEFTLSTFALEKGTFILDVESTVPHNDVVCELKGSGDINCRFSNIQCDQSFNTDTYGAQELLNTSGYSGHANVLFDQLYYGAGMETTPIVLGKNINLSFVNCSRIRDDWIYCSGEGDNLNHISFINCRFNNFTPSSDEVLDTFVDSATGYTCWWKGCNSHSYSTYPGYIISDGSFGDFLTYIPSEEEEEEEEENGIDDVNNRHIWYIRN